MPILGSRAGASVNGYGMFGKAFPTTIVTGGTLTSDSTYFYRTFTSNGTLSVTNGTVAADYALIGGGGGGFSSIYIDYANGTGWGQAFFGGPGGAGGYQNANAQTLSGSYNITIGGGGSGGIYTNSVNPTAGNATTGFSLSASGGGVGGTRDGGAAAGGGGCGGGGGGQYGTQTGPPGLAGSGGGGSQGGNGSSGYPGAGGGSGTTPGTTGNSGVNIFSIGTTYGFGGGNRGGNTGDGGVGGSITTARYSGDNSGDGTGGASGIVIVRYLKSAVA